MYKYYDFKIKNLYFKLHILYKNIYTNSNKCKI